MTIPVPSFVILVSAVLVLSCRQTDTQTESQRRMIAIRYTHATTVGVSKKNFTTVVKRQMLQKTTEISSVEKTASFVLSLIPRIT